MERLTETGIVYNFTKLDVAESRWLERVQKRLAAYEDTGLEPEDFALGLNAAARKKAGSEYYGLTPEQLDKAVDLFNADREGRVILLPCKVDDGDMVYYSDEDSGRVLMGYVSQVSKLSDGATYFEFTNVESDIAWVAVELPISDFIKTVFLTREEAEAALAVAKNATTTEGEKRAENGRPSISAEEG